MSKQLTAILKTRYFSVVLLTCLSILMLNLYFAMTDVSKWNEQKDYYHSSEFIKSYENENDENRVENDSSHTIKKQPLARYQKEILLLMQQGQSYDENGQPTEESQPYYTVYLSDTTLLFTVIVVVAGFLLFFADLKTSFNSFLFSLGCSKKMIFWKKYWLVAVPILGTLLISMFVYNMIILANIPAEYVNISYQEFFSSILITWLLYIFYFCSASFIGLATGNLLLGPLTAITFAMTFESFIDAIIHLKDFLFGNTTDRFLPFFSHGITKNPINLTSITLLISLSFLSIFLGYKLYSKLTLEKNGQYLLFDMIQWPLFIVMVLYTSIFAVFSRGFYYSPVFEEAPSIIPVFLFYFFISIIIIGYLIFQKNIHHFIHSKKKHNHFSY